MVSKKVLKAVAAEFEHEQSSYAIDESFQPYLEKSGFTLSEKESSPQITLRKQNGDFAVEVTFLARTPDTQEGEEGGEAESQSYVDFQVAVQKNKSKGALVFECTSQQSELSIVGLMHTKDLGSLDRTNIYQQSSEYRGPEFNTLDDKLQACLVEYLESLGVDDELSVFLESYSLDKEQRLYMEWLSNIKQFLS
jgi:complement component 1 Q subcomponent-binding protein